MTLDLCVSSSMLASSNSADTFFLDFSSLSLVIWSSSILCCISSKSFSIFFLFSSSLATCSLSSSAFFLASWSWLEAMERFFSMVLHLLSSSSSCSRRCSFSCSSALSLLLAASFCLVSSSRVWVMSVSWLSSTSELLLAWLAFSSASLRLSAMDSISCKIFPSFSWASVALCSLSMCLALSSPTWPSSCFLFLSASCLLPDTDLSSCVMSANSDSYCAFIFSAWEACFLTWSSWLLRLLTSWLCLCLISVILCSWLLTASSRVLLVLLSSFSLAVLSSCWAAVTSRLSRSSFLRASSSSLRSLFCFSALFLASFSASRSSATSLS